MTLCARKLKYFLLIFIFSSKVFFAGLQSSVVDAGDV